MLNTLVICLLIAGVVATVVSVKIKELRILALILACCCVAACFGHFVFKSNADKEYIRILADTDVKTKIDYYKKTSINNDLKNQIIYSIADNIGNLSITSFKTAFLNNDEPVIVELLFDRLRENGQNFSEEQLDCFVEAAISNKNANFRKRLFPSAFAIEAVFKLTRNCLQNINEVSNCKILQSCVEAFPEIYSENDRKLANNILEAKINIGKADGSESKSNEKLAELTALKKDYANQLISVTIDWSLRGTVERKLENFENGYLLKDANIEGKSLERCILIPTETKLGIGSQVKISVKDDGEQYLKLDDGFATLRCFKEDYSSGTRNTIQEKINNCDDEIAKINANLEGEKDNLDVYKAFFSACLDSFKKNFAQKVKKYEYR